ncbi:MAG: RNA-dependent DNA polymerase [Candidatus Komeilibacteria bacterium CG_4_10_14_0_2_um_filter_37_10]|uniref:RNA-dependent DNA polymerase n=1 Tax=Candidatus Komeilibacteria bacterium CG_4_10_14_0_2_um_filter_37_10 TaxID=1974470 RepID=A0A2M7VD02_9BACT|nr:MAG: RNA-dependent DNA polymerase [Candidatus Komeilibacteria bacterium CG_4_10_14_0_2_um_filter_37_10]
MKIQLTHKFEDIISLENLLTAWQEFLCGKRNRKDVQEFCTNLMDNIFQLYRNLVYHKYEHGGYEAFKVFDPKIRNIHKASINDRLLHHAIYRQLYPFFDRTFIFDSYSCRLGKGTHKAIIRFNQFFLRVSRNNAKICWVLKGDIKSFFASIDHELLINILKEYIPDKYIIWLLKNIINSFQTREGKGLPLGNLTSQLFANIYLNEFDQFVKHKIKAKFYIRYVDDFTILSDNKKWLENQINLIEEFLLTELKLNIHPKKIFIRTVSSGVDFLGWINFPDHRILRKTTRLRMIRRLKDHFANDSLNSYLGLMKHGNSNKIKSEILTFFKR